MPSPLRVAAGLALIVAPPALAQPVAHIVVDSCLAALHESAFTRVGVFADAELHDAGASAALPMVDLFVQLLGVQARAFLGAKPDDLPAGDLAVSWRGLDRDLQVVLHRDGRVEGAIEPDSGAPAGLGPPAELLARIVAAMRDAGPRLDWPADLAADSVAFRVVMRHATVARDGTLAPPRARLAVPLFSLAVPWQTPVSVLKAASPSYPHRPERAGMEGVVILEYVVEATGRVDEATIRDVWNAPEPRPTGSLGAHYRALIESASRAVVRSRFQPALAGGCAVPRRVRQEFDFRMRPDSD